MRAVLFVVVASILSASAYSPLHKQPPSRLDIYEEDKKKSNDESIPRANFVLIGDAMKNQANIDTTLPRGGRRVHRSERVTNEPHKTREKRQFHHYDDHLYDDVPDSHISNRHIQAAYNYYPDPLQRRAHYHIPDPHSPYGHYHVQVHYHYDPHADELYPHPHVQYHPFRA